MRHLLALLMLTLVGCIGADPATYGTKTTATRDCRDPQTAYAREVVGLEQLGLAAWRLRADLSQAVDVEVHCGDFTSDCMDFGIRAACGDAAGYFTLGTDVVHVDHGRANGLFAFAAAMNHELVHWYINQGPHPERARMHICPCGAPASMAGECWAGGCGGENLMSVSLAGLGPGTSTTWDGNTETIDVGEIAQHTPTALDREFVRWAVTP